MLHTTIPLACYLDEAGDDPVAAALQIRNYQIGSVCLRYAWSTPIYAASDQACKKLRGILQDNSLQVVATAGSADIGRSVLIAEYFGARMIVFEISSGRQISTEDMVKIAAKAAEHNLVPVLEMGPGMGQPPEAAAVAGLLAAYPSWYLLYDPAALILGHPGSADPFLKYWTLLKNRVIAMDLRDYKIGEGFRVVGDGDVGWPRMFNDAKSMGYRGWYFLEPGFGRRHGQANSKSESFCIAIEGLNNCLGGITNANTGPGRQIAIPQQGV